MDNNQRRQSLAFDSTPKQKQFWEGCAFIATKNKIVSQNQGHSDNVEVIF